tara:strand:- start:599 stop:1465 length:867 start_codon:yes stop_codon:yes gene_type:complete
LIFDKKLINNDIINRVVNIQTKNLFIMSLSKMFKKNFISIIIPYHKKKFFFKETIQSINNQSYKNFEVIIIYDDTDKSELNYVKKIINNFKFRKKLIINNKIIGAGLSRNKGIKVSKGEYIAFCDADDLWNKDKLKIQLRFMKDEKILFSHSNYFIINHASKKIGSFKVPKNISYNQLIKSCDIGLSSVMISKLLIKKNLFSNLKTKEDYLLWIKLIRHLKNFKSINENLIYWRYLRNSLSSSSIQKLDDAFKLYRNHLNFSFLFSIFCTLRLSFYALIKKTIMYLKV